MPILFWNDIQNSCYSWRRDRHLNRGEYKFFGLGMGEVEFVASKTFRWESATLRETLESLAPVELRKKTLSAIWFKGDMKA